MIIWAEKKERKNGNGYFLGINDIGFSINSVINKNKNKKDKIVKELKITFSEELADDISVRVGDSIMFGFDPNDGMCAIKRSDDINNSYKVKRYGKEKRLHVKIPYHRVKEEYRCYLPKPKKRFYVNDISIEREDSYKVLYCSIPSDYIEVI
jgi:hypothetical protein